MASIVPLGAPPKRHRVNRVEGRRGRGDGSSRDASEEDNDASDVGSLLSVNAVASPKTATLLTPPPSAATGAGTGTQAAPAQMMASTATPVTASQQLPRRRIKELTEEGLSEGLESPTYDGDVESSSTIGTPVHVHSHVHPHASHAHTHTHTHARRPSSPTPGPHSHSPYSQRLPTPKASRANLLDLDVGTTTAEATDATTDVTPALSSTVAMANADFLPPLQPHSLPRPPRDVPVAPSAALDNPALDVGIAGKINVDTPIEGQGQTSLLVSGNVTPPTPGSERLRMFTRPEELSVEDIREFVQHAIDGTGEVGGMKRTFRTNPPPSGRAVRIYADGVYDLFHFGHALQLRQAKLSFPSVHLMVGVCSDALCAAHKSAPAMTHAERCESIRHCRWADEVVPDAPWVLDQAWIDKYEIDYIAHDEDLYPSKGHDDVYMFVKSQGKFLPTRRTPAISTSELLERIVRGYRDGFFDSKLEKNGLSELMAADVDWDSDQSVARREKRIAAAKAKGRKEK